MAVKTTENACPKEQCNGALAFNGDGMNEEGVEGKWFVCNECKATYLEPRNGKYCPTC